MHKKKLLIVGTTQGGYGGIEAFMIALAESASKWAEFDVRLCFKLVKGGEFKTDLIKSSEQICKEVFYVKRGSSELTKLVSWADILHVQNMPPDIVFPARLLSKKIFLTVHNRRVPVFSLHNLIWSLTIKLGKKRWYNSNFVWDTWEPGNKSVNSDCIPTVCRLPQGWCPPEQRKGFLFIGRWIDNKGIPELIKAYALNKFDPSEWPLIILGDGPLKPTVLSLIKELGLKNVNLPGFVDDNTKQTYLSSARWLVAPARTLEDMGLTPIEARSVGVPSIVTRDGGLPESGGEAALIAEPGDINGLAECLKIAAAMGEIEYKQRGQLAKDSLDTYLRPIEFYRNAYSN